MLGGEVVEGEQCLAIFRQAFDGLLVLDAVSFDERIERSLGGRPSLRHPDILRARLALACRLFGSLFKTFAVLCTQQRCARVFGQHLVDRLPEAERRQTEPARESLCGLDPVVTHECRAGTRQKATRASA
jgi:hypothetical protein